MTPVAALLAPVVRWHEEYGFALADRDARAALARGALGVHLTDGPLAEVTALTAAWRATVTRPLFVSAELGGGVGERFEGGTALPPLAAFTPGDVDAVRRAAVLTAREARAAGVSWALAPSGVDPALASPLVRSRTVRGDADAVAAMIEAWVDGCQSEGVVATPGPYPLMQAAAARGAFEAGAGALLLAAPHLHDAEVVRYLREVVGFEGVIVAPVGMVADAQHEDEEPLAVAALAAGADLLLGLEEPLAVEHAVRAALRAGQLDADALAGSAARIAQWAAWADPRVGGRAVTLDEALWARRAADAAVLGQRGRAFPLRDPIELVVVDDDPPRRVPAGTVLAETLAQLGHDVRRVGAPSGDSRGTVLVALFGDRRLALGFERHSDGALARVDEALARADAQARDALVVHFTPPEQVAGMEAWPVLVCGWSGTRAMEEAVARWCARLG
jgi:beta-glucosidase-like glycosyl hydrolase